MRAVEVKDGEVINVYDEEVNSDFLLVDIIIRNGYTYNLGMNSLDYVLMTVKDIINIGVYDFFIGFVTSANLSVGHDNHTIEIWVKFVSEEDKALYLLRYK